MSHSQNYVLHFTFSGNLRKQYMIWARDGNIQLLFCMRKVERWNVFYLWLFKIDVGSLRFIGFFAFVSTDICKKCKKIPLSTFQQIKKQCLDKYVVLTTDFKYHFVVSLCTKLYCESIFIQELGDRNGTGKWVEMSYFYYYS